MTTGPPSQREKARRDGKLGCLPSLHIWKNSGLQTRPMGSRLSWKAELFPTLSLQPSSWPPVHRRRPLSEHAEGWPGHGCKFVTIIHNRSLPQDYDELYGYKLCEKCDGVMKSNNLLSISPSQTFPRTVSLWKSNSNTFRSCIHLLKNSFPYLI